jgi:6,7-dimethyl-8-ribityllumazine synthase
VTVPGALEIPTALAIALDAAAAKRKPYDGAVALGCVIRGDTIHFEIVSEQSARGVMDVSIARKIPIGNGILTVNNEGQANVRANLDEGDKGGEAARATLTLIQLKRSISKK